MSDSIHSAIRGIKDHIAQITCERDELLGVCQAREIEIFDLKAKVAELEKTNGMQTNPIESFVSNIPACNCLNESPTYRGNPHKEGCHTRRVYEACLNYAKICQKGISKFDADNNQLKVTNETLTRERDDWHKVADDRSYELNRRMMERDGALDRVSELEKDKARLDWILALIRRKGTDGLLLLSWSNPADSDPMESDDVILDRAAIDAAMERKES